LPRSSPSRPPQAESEDHDRFSTSPLCHALLHPIALHGPVTSMTLSYINGLEGNRVHWEDFIEARAGHAVGIANPDLSFDDLDELSEAEIHVLEATWDQFGHMPPFEIRNYTHENCPEWEDPHGSSMPIPYERVLKFLRKEHSAEIAAEIEAQRSLDKFLAYAK
jgi:hypothetical protein